MEYKVSRLAEEYLLYLSQRNIEMQYVKMPTFSLNAYNEYEYISVLQELNNKFDQISSLPVTEKFLKGD